LLFEIDAVSIVLFPVLISEDSVAEGELADTPVGTSTLTKITAISAAQIMVSFLRMNANIAPPVLVCNQEPAPDCVRLSPVLRFFFGFPPARRLPMRAFYPPPVKCVKKTRSMCGALEVLSGVDNQASASAGRIESQRRYAGKGSKPVYGVGNSP
jgi:hypothetical protein